MKTQICSVKKLNQRQCRNKSLNKVCDYHRYHPYLSGPKLKSYITRMRQRNYEENNDISDDDKMNVTNYKTKSVKFEDEIVKENKETNVKSTDWKLMLMCVMFSVGVFSYSNLNLLGETKTMLEESLLNYYKEIPDIYNNIVKSMTSLYAFYTNAA